MFRQSLITLIGALLPCLAWNATIQVSLYSTAEPRTEVGSLTFTDTAFGLKIEPSLTIAAGRYGMHIHEKPDCSNQGKSAGGHLDPKDTQVHQGPYDATGHLGDLPMVVVDAKIPQVSSLAPRLSVDKILNRAVIVHAEGDNYSDQPLPLGGGGARAFCGVIQGTTL